MKKEVINQYLDELEHQLLNESTVIPVEVSSTWINQFPEAAAVFILREDDAIVYVSETDNLKNKMAELIRTKGFGDDMNGLLNEVIAKHLKLSYLVVDLGRKELEERIWDKTVTPKRTYTKAEKQQSHKNAYEKWTMEDDEKLELLFCERKTVKELSALFGRNEGSINSRIKKLELREKYDR